MLWQALGGVGATVVILGLAWFATRARGLRHYRLDVHVIVHRDDPDNQGDQPHDPR